jgi:hypothetical protein
MRSITSGIITSRFVRPDIVLIGHHYINLSIGVKVLSNKLKESANCRIKSEQRNSYPYRRGRVVTTVRKRQSVRPRSRWILIKYASHKPIDLLLGHSCLKKESHQLKISLSLINREKSGFTLSRFTTRIGTATGIRMIASPNDQGGEFIEDGTLRRNGTP